MISSTTFDLTSVGVSFRGNEGQESFLLRREKNFFPSNKYFGQNETIWHYDLKTSKTLVPSDMDTNLMVILLLE